MGRFLHSGQKAKGTNNQKYGLELRGDHNVILWMRNIDFRNTLKSNRFLIWKKFGFVPSGITFREQQTILKGEKHPDDYYLDVIPLGENIAPVLVRRRLILMENLESFITKT